MAPMSYFSSCQVLLLILLTVATAAAAPFANAAAATHFLVARSVVVGGH